MTEREREREIEDLKRYVNQKLITIMKLCGICTKCQSTKLVVGSACVSPPQYFCPTCDIVLPQKTPNRMTTSRKLDDTLDETPLDLSMLDK